MRVRRFRPRTGPGNSKEHYRDFSAPESGVSAPPPWRPNYPDPTHDPSLVVHDRPGRRPTGEKG